MKSSDEISVVLSEAGPLDDTVLSVSRLADDRWVVQFGDVDVEVEHDAGGRVMFSTLVGTPPPLRAAQIYEALLSYSMLWRETGGVRMALDGPAGSVVQMIDLPSSELRPDVVVTLAVNLARRTAIWRDFLDDPTPAATPSADLGSMLGHLIRV